MSMYGLRVGKGIFNLQSGLRSVRGGELECGEPRDMV